MKWSTYVISLALAAVLLLPYQNVRADYLGDPGLMCDSSSAHAERLDRLLFDKVPSLMEDCGIGGLFNLCDMLGSFGSVVGDFIGNRCGGGGGGGSNSLFCDWGFDLESAKQAYRLLGRQSHSASDDALIAQNQANQTQSDLAGRRLAVLGIIPDNDEI